MKIERKRKLPKELRRNGILFMIAACLFFSSMGALVKYTTGRLPVTEAVFFRAFVSLLIITPWMIYKRIRLIGHHLPLLLLRSASGFTALSLSFYVISKIPLADASILNHTSVLFVAILSALFLREKVTAPLLIYIVCALVGVALMIKPSFDVVNVAGLLGLASGLFASIAYVSIKQLHKTDSFFTMVFSFSLFSSAASFALFQHQFIEPHGTEWAALIGMGILGTVAQLMMTYAYKHTDASIVSPYSFSAVLFAAMFGIIFWGEIPDRWSILGGSLIVACGIGIMKLKKAKGETVIEYEEDLANLSENQP